MNWKRLLTIYLIGVVISGLMSYKLVMGVNKEFHMKTTYGDVASVAFISLTSWVGVIITGVAIVTQAKFWDTPISR